jgi:hypothetical protein
MAPVLQCPDCGQKHPLDAVRETPAFNCQGCGRMLKVPEQFLPPTPEPPPPPVFPPRRIAPPPKARGPVGTELPRVVRILIWVLAVPLAFLLVFGFTRAFGFLSQRQLEDAFLRSDWSRFWPIARVLPFWALITALLVHFGNIGIVRWRRNAAKKKSGPRSTPRSRRPINGRPPRGSGLPRTSAGGESPTRTSRVS